MAFSFEQYVQKGNEFMLEVAKELGHPDDTDRAYRVFRSVTHALRDNITLQENLHLISQLPMMIKAVYVDSWTATSKHDLALDEFIVRVQMNNTTNSLRDLDDPEEALRAVEAVFDVLKRHVSPGEIGHIIGILPAELKPLLRD